MPDDLRTGYHLLHAMAQLRREALDLLEEFRRTDRADLGSCLLERRANVGHLTIQHQKYLNTEDDESTAAVETATELALAVPPSDQCAVHCISPRYTAFGSRAVYLVSKSPVDANPSYAAKRHGRPSRDE